MQIFENAPEQTGHAEFARDLIAANNRLERENSELRASLERLLNELSLRQDLQWPGLRQAIINTNVTLAKG